jgi:hypothetical protein
VLTLATADDRIHRYPLADLKSVHIWAQLDNSSGALVPEHFARLHRDQSREEMFIGEANTRALEPN